MPFQSEKQRRYLHANHPEIAKRWERDYAHGGILDINESEEIISDDGNDIELTAYNAAFDDPNDLSTGVRTLFQAKDGGAIGGGTIKGEPRGNRTGFRNPHEATAQAGGKSGYSGGNYGGANKSPGHPSNQPSISGPTQDTTPSDGGMGAKEQYIQTQYTSPEADDARTRRELIETVKTGPGSPIEKYDTQEQHLADIPGELKGPPSRVNTYKTRVNVNYKNDNYEQALANQKAKLKSWGLQQLIPLGIMIAMGVPLNVALKAFPKTISISKTDMINLVKHSLPVAKAKKELIEALGLHKGALVKDVDITNPNEMVNLEETTDFTKTRDQLTELTTTPKDDDTKGDGPELPPQLGGPSTQEMATEYVEQPDWWGAAKSGQQKYKDFLAKIERERLAREENPIVSGTETEIIALRNSGGLANLFRVKNQ